jgi:hypothetical protein
VVLFWRTKWPVFVNGKVIRKPDLHGNYDEVYAKHMNVVKDIKKH